MKINRKMAKKVLETVDAGLVAGLGKPESGNLCVEAAVCLAMGYPHSDKPICVGSAVREFAINLNDSNWPTNEDRTKGMRKLSIAQLGSDLIDQMQFSKSIAFNCQKKILPFVMQNASSFETKYSEEINILAEKLKNSDNLESACALTIEAKELLHVASASANTHAHAYAYAYAYAHAYANTHTHAYAYASAYAYAYAHAYASANTHAYAYASAYVYSYAHAHAHAHAKLRLELLNMLSEIGVNALLECKSPGCDWLDLCD